MIGIIVTGHGGFATGILSTLKLIAGNQEEVLGVDFPEEYSVEMLQGSLREAVNALGHEIIIFTDLEGGSPYNKSVEIKVGCEEKVIEVIAGTNFPMLLTGAMGREGVGMEGLLGEIMEMGASSITRFVLAPRKHIETEEEGI